MVPDVGIEQCEVVFRTKMATTDGTAMGVGVACH